VTLQGFVLATNGPTTNLWKVYSGPGTVTFGNSSQTNTSVSFSAAGTYTLMLSGDDGVHAVAYDAVVIAATPAIRVTISTAGTNAILAWTGAAPPYVIEQAGALSPAGWSTLLTTNAQSVSIPVESTNQFFRVRGQSF
jgi:hypothetical protein